MRVEASFDDGTKDDLKIAHLMAKYDIPTVFYWPVDFNATNMQKGRKSLTPHEAQIITRDFEIGSHTITHPLLTRIPFNEAKWQITESKTMLEDLYDIKVTKFSYPRGYANPELEVAVKDAGYKSARSTLVGYIHESENPYFQQNTVHVGRDRKEYAGMSWLTYAYKMLEEATKVEDSVYSIFGHSWELTEFDGWYDLEVLLKDLR